MLTDTDKLINEHLNAAANDGHDLDGFVDVTIAKRNGVAMWHAPDLTARDAGRPAAVETMTAAPGDDVTMPLRAAIRLAACGWIAGVAPEEASRVADLPALYAEQAEDLAQLDAMMIGDDEAERADAAALEAFLPPADGETLTESHLVGGQELPAFPESHLTLDELKKLGAAELIGHLGQWPGDADRARDLELGRKPSAQRGTVLGVLETLLGPAPE